MARRLRGSTLLVLLASLALGQRPDSSSAGSVSLLGCQSEASGEPETSRRAWPPGDAGECAAAAPGLGPSMSLPLPTFVVVFTSADGRVLMVLVVSVAQATLPPPPPPLPTTGTRGMVDVFTSLNVRSGPGLEYPRLGGLAPGQPVTILGEQDGWCLIAHAGGTAWVSGRYVWTGAGAPRNRTLLGSPTEPLPQSRQPEEQFQSAPGGGVAPAPAASRAGRRRSDGGLDVPLYAQGRVGARYPDGFCGPTSLKMALEYYGIRRDVNYLGLSDVGGGTPVYVRGRGAGHQGLLDMARHCGLQGSTMAHGRSLAWLKAQTDAGRPLLVSVAGDYGPRSTGGHILVVVGVTASGDVIINDSADGRRHVCPALRFYEAWSSSDRMAIVMQP